MLFGGYDGYRRMLFAPPFRELEAKVIAHVLVRKEESIQFGQRRCPFAHPGWGSNFFVFRLLFVFLNGEEVVERDNHP